MVSFLRLLVGVVRDMIAKHYKSFGFGQDLEEFEVLNLTVLKLGIENNTFRSDFMISNRKEIGEAVSRREEELFQNSLDLGGAWQ
jgi:hypothetical protein